MVYGFTEHARDRMRELGVTVDEILIVLSDGEIIERYPDRNGHLILGWTASGPVHVPVVRDRRHTVTLVVTVYRPEAMRWRNNRVRRR